MADHLIKLPSVFRYLNQFQPSKWAAQPSLMLCGEASTAMAAEIAYPGRYIPEELMYDLCLKWAGADVASDPNGSTITEVMNWLKSAYIGYIDLQPLVDQANAGNTDPLRHMLGNMNKQNVAHIITVADESQLHQAVPNSVADPNNPYVRGAKLHNWADQGMSHVMLRVGFSDTDGYGLYAEPAAPAFCEDSKGNFQPVKILWSDILSAKILHCVAIMPNGVAVPPQGIDFDWTTPWPVPAPVLDFKASLSDLEMATNMLASVSGALGDLPNAKFSEIPSVLDTCKRTLASVQSMHSKLADDLKHVAA